MDASVVGPDVMGFVIVVHLLRFLLLLCSLVLSHDDVLDRKVGQGTDSHKMENWCEAAGLDVLGAVSLGKSRGRARGVHV